MASIPRAATRSHLTSWKLGKIIPLINFSTTFRKCSHYKINICKILSPFHFIISIKIEIYVTSLIFLSFKVLSRECYLKTISKNNSLKIHVEKSIKCL